MKGTLTTSSFNFFFVLFLIIHQTEMKMTPHFIHVSTAFFLKSEVFLPLEIYHHKKNRRHSEMIGCDFFFYKGIFFWGGDESKPLPQIFQHEGGGTKQGTNKKQLQPVTWFCLLFPIYIN